MQVEEIAQKYQIPHLKGWVNMINFLEIDDSDKEKIVQGIHIRNSRMKKIKKIEKFLQKNNN